MRWLLAILLLVSSTAHADGDHFTLYGFGSARAHDEAGWLLRIEKRLDATRTKDKGDHPLVGGRLGVEYWNAGGHWGIAMPVGMYFGGQVKNMRTTLGAGLGLWAFEMGGGGKEGYGIAPFVSGSLEMLASKRMIISLDGRVSRQVVTERGDFNVYSVMLSLGPRYSR